MAKQNRYLIVGGGLAGFSIALHLEERSIDFRIVDPGINHSSIIAAGMINPLVFRRMNLSWRAKESIDYLRLFYRGVESKTSLSFFQNIDLRRIFSSQQERDNWLDRSSKPEFLQFMHPINDSDDAYNQAPTPFGTGRLKNAFAVNTEVFISGIREHFMNQDKLTLLSFDHSDLTGMEYQGKSYDGVIFCEGYQLPSNPWFGELPLGQTKGEVLKVRTEALPESEPLNRKCFVLPIGNHTFKVGSTYGWHTPDIEPSEEGKKQILEKLSYICTGDVEVVDHTAGVRPTSPDRRPMIGPHWEHKDYYVFNGLGTKGYMIAPLLAKEFVEFLLDVKDLPEEVRVERFYPGR